MSQSRKVAVVTGASSGIGQAMAKQLAAHHYDLVLIARRQDRLEALAAEINRIHGVDTFVLAGDVTQTSFIESIVPLCKSRFGRIDLLFQAAGYGVFKRVTQFSYAEIVAMFEVNTFAIMYLSQLVALEMLDQGSGQIVMVASSAGKLSTIASSVYSATKAAVIAYADTLRLELRPAGIEVIVVNPGPVVTEFFDRDANSKAYFKTIEGFALDVDVLTKRIMANLLSPCKFKREVNAPLVLELLARLNSIFPTISDILKLNLFNLKENSDETTV
ncbi:SDR family NAD(P)-dependent oxidoreductase [Eremococcus coleocola]|uniref:SDR family NAD(P)-dependent oxidoreductase n=1 Tax=Eremococcus coleocola TaxID=88132 RepID=UPI000419A70A|nr:SDR family NAD(P)-dependent oxidoreductase [Eremococcus coleocola]